MRLPARLLLGAALTAALAGCGGQFASSTDDTVEETVAAPTQLTPEDRLARTAAFLTARFGESAQRGAAWRDSDGSRPVHRYVCLDGLITWEGIETSVLGVCANRDDASDTDAGLLDVFFLRPDADGGLAVAAQLLGYPSGLGGVAAEPVLIGLGSDQPALLLEQPVASDTVTRTDTVLLAALGTGLREVARFPASIDNRLHLHCDAPADAASDDAAATPFAFDEHTGTADTHSHTAGDDSLAAADVDAQGAVNCDAGLIQLATTWQADTSADADWWPLQVEQSGVACGSAVAQRHALVIDRARLTYSSAPLMEQCP